MMEPTNLLIFKVPLNLNITTNWLKLGLKELVIGNQFTELWSVTWHREITQCYLPPDNKWTCPTLPPIKQADTWFTYLKGMEGWADIAR